ncbi:D-hexose-6-phosphate mutarotase [Ramlibacter alkalitolerans]|uniref:Putative glucose-6-phosphate 1-epimerase n=1 Tax=Ramlibacter alkalitolerans TaxID=2039631 RepID=A0ABS1JWL0_9BURK|nr:D-hexose-6-phosphate mutarotase [Ramlibacter alkalitolerans]MBL0428705.1 D-hexose-6-phosphate mutarotase [Ramlibacter alkalitolerans]
MTTAGPARDSAEVPLHNAAGDEASFSLHGAQLLSWVPRGAGEQIYLSPLSRPAAGKSARGGTPVCFPQFADRGPLPKHGFVRTAHWELVSPPLSGTEVAEARFQIDSASSGFAWEHAFCLVLVARLGPGWLELELQAANTGRSAYDFTAALHTYLATDVRAARLHGLQGCDYEDNLAGRRVQRERSPFLAVAGEVDRVYLQVPGVLRLEEGASQRRVMQQGFTDVVVWNPGPAKAAQLGDMPPQDWERMLCIEAGVIGQPVHLPPGKTWHGLQRLELG